MTVALDERPHVLPLMQISRIREVMTLAEIRELVSQLWICSLKTMIFSRETLLSKPSATGWLFTSEGALLVGT
jgi:hypothetical protein